MAGLSRLLRDEAGRDRLLMALAAKLPEQKWYAGKGAASAVAVSLRDAVVLHASRDDAGSEGGRNAEPVRNAEAATDSDGCLEFGLLLADVTCDGECEPSDCYVIPVSTGPPAGRNSGQVLLSEGGCPVEECSADPQFWKTLLRQVRAGAIETLAGGRLLFATPAAARRAMHLPGDWGSSEISVSPAEQSNTAVMLGTWGFLKLFRRVEAGVNPDVETGTFLTGCAEPVRVPAVLGTLELQPGSGGVPVCLAVLLEQVAADEDAWQFTLRALADFWRQVAVQCADWPAERIPSEASAALLAGLIGSYLDAVMLLGRRTAELHRALASDTENAAFRPEPADTALLAEQWRRVGDELAGTCRLLGSCRAVSGAARLASQLAVAGQQRLSEIGRQIDRLPAILQIRVHGDYHLGQVLRTRDDFVIVDFEGEPDRPLAERREKRCVLKDVAGMVRSLHYASHAASVGLLPAPDPAIAAVDAWRNQWFDRCRRAFLRGYFDVPLVPGLSPEDPVARAALLDLFLVEKALYELRYEINHRPGWAGVPLAGLAELFRLQD